MAKQTRSELRAEIESLGRVIERKDATIAAQSSMIQNLSRDNGNLKIAVRGLSRAAGRGEGIDGDTLVALGEIIL